MMVGDLPDMYWTLALPDDVAPFFTLDVDLKDVTAAMVRRKPESQKMKPFVPPPGTVALAMRVPVMGWSWAVFLAQSFLMDACFSLKDSPITEERMLVEGAPAPQLSWDQPWLINIYIDDFGLVRLVRTGADKKELTR